MFKKSISGLCIIAALTGLAACSTNNSSYNGDRPYLRETSGASYAASGNYATDKNDYLVETRRTWPEKVDPNAAKIVFVRDEAKNVNMPTVFVNNRVVGSLAPSRFSETYVCPGEQIVRTGTRSDEIVFGDEVRFNSVPGNVYYVQILDASNAKFNARALTEEQAKELLKGVKQSHIIDRHQPVCGQTKTVKRIDLSADALFKFDQDVMLPAGQASVEKLVRDIRELGAKVDRIRVVGHTDRLGSDSYNDRLSTARAVAVANHMKMKGLMVPVETVGRGEKEPVTNGCVGDKATPSLVACLQPDRRVSIELIGFDGSK